MFIQATSSSLSMFNGGPKVVILILDFISFQNPEIVFFCVSYVHSVIAVPTNDTHRDNVYFFIRFYCIMEFMELYFLII